MRSLGKISLLLFLSFAGAVPATAQRAPEWSTCTGKEGVNRDVQFKSCTALIQSGRETPRDRAVAYFNRTRTYNFFTDEERSRVIADLNETIKLDPSHAGAYKNRALMKSMNGDRDGQIADLSEAIRLDAKDTGSLVGRGQAYDFKGDPDRAIADFSEAIRLDPKYATAHMSRGVAYGKKRDYDRAVADLSEAIRIDPKYETAYFFRGNVYAAKGDHDRAIADHSEVIRLQPNATTSYHRRGVSYAAKGDHDRALADFDAALKLTPDYAPARNGRELSREAKRQSELQARGLVAPPTPPAAGGQNSAARAASTVTQRDRDDCKQFADGDRIIAGCTRIIQDQSESASERAAAHRQRGSAYSRSRATDRAIADFDAAIKLDPKNAAAYTERGHLYFTKNDHSRAIADYSEAVKLDPNQITHNNRGYAYLEKKDYDRAIADFSEAIRLDPQFVSAYGNRGAAFLFKKNYDRAIADYDVAIRMDPIRADWRTNRENARAAKRAAAAPQKPSEPRHWLGNNTRVAFDVIDNGKTVCSLGPGDDCWWPAGSGQHMIELRRADGKTIRKTLSISGYRGVLHQLICSQDVSRSDLPRDAC